MWAAATGTSADLTATLVAAPGSSGGPGARQTVIDSIHASFWSDGDTVSCLEIVIRDDTTTLAGQLFAAEEEAAGSVSGPFRDIVFPGGFSMISTNPNVQLNHINGSTDQIRLLVLYHYEA